MRSAFGGFPPQALTFFRGLARNNDREWFLPRKQVFEDCVRRPMIEAVEALNDAMREYAPDYVTDPDKAIYRIYRDVRFSRNKAPYKTQIGASFRRRGLERHASAGDDFHVSHKEVAVGGGIYMPTPETLRAVRAHLGRDPDEFRRISASRAIRKTLGEVQGEQLSRVPKGFLPDHPAADLLRYKQWLLYVELDPGIAATPKLFTEVNQRFKAMAPWIEFLNRPLVLAARKPARW